MEKPPKKLDVYEKLLLILLIALMGAKILLHIAQELYKVSYVLANVNWIALLNTGIFFIILAFCCHLCAKAGLKLMVEQERMAASGENPVTGN